MVSLTVELLAEPAVLVATARNWSPDIAVVVLLRVREVVAEPVMLAPSVKFAQAAPWFVEICHRNDGAGKPMAATVKVTGLPAKMVWLSGWVVITGATGPWGVARKPWASLLASV